MKRFFFISGILILAAQLPAQTAALRGGSAVLSNGANTITLAVPSGLLESYTLTLPSAQSGANLWLNLTNGAFGWGTPTEGGSGGGVQIAPLTEQVTSHNNEYLFDVEYASTAVGPLPGAILSSLVDNPNPTATGITIVAKNTNAAATNVAINGLIINVTNDGSGTNNGVCATAEDDKNTANDYAMVITGKSGTLCGMGTTTPTENLEVNGNIRISGQNKLKINEWSGVAATAGTMGTATLVNGTKVVATTSVTANSRIFMTIQTAAGAIGKIYVSARTAGTSFTITSTSATDGSTVAWWIVEP